MKLLIAMITAISLNAFAIEQDKIQHMAAGTAIYAGCMLFTHYEAKECLIPVAFAAVGKEVYDANYGGTSDFNDITATMFIPLGTYVVYEW